MNEYLFIKLEKTERKKSCIKIAKLIHFNNYFFKLSFLSLAPSLSPFKAAPNIPMILKYSI